ncbi:hypothetical protein B5M42_005515 [Paenibacillus athensensis]|uniref:Uncharacterized protein n=1 Tax=Paenibacillus athensensis TaxID=1967502 RepID=A0A4Y8Q2X8_9BACL|nr:hypothetical protein [Paenibacillus athensensis]MCD1258299.1 hypothetical protein [Paenibacillus athensensis]
MLSKKVMTGTIAAAVLLGGGLYGAAHNRAFADDTATSTPAVHSKDGASDGKGFKERGGRGGDRMGGMKRGAGPLESAATLLGVEQKDLMSELAAGKTLAQIASDKQGWDEATLLQKLTEAEQAKLDEAVTAGKLTQEQADKQKADMADRLKSFVENTRPADGKSGPGFGGERGHGGPGGFGGMGGKGGEFSALPDILGMTQEELQAELEAGKSPADIAAEKGISEDQLISKLKDSMTDRLKSFVEQKGHARPSRGDAPAASPQPAASSAPTGA